MKKSTALYREVKFGGQSNIFKQRNTLPYIKGYDANSLYLYCLNEDHFIGPPELFVLQGEYLLTKCDTSSIRSRKKT